MGYGAVNELPDEGSLPSQLDLVTTSVPPCAVQSLRSSSVEQGAVLPILSLRILRLSCPMASALALERA